MKFCSTLLALSVFNPYVLGTNAFLFQAPKPLTSKGWKTTDSLTTTFSSVGDRYPSRVNGSSRVNGVNGVNGVSRPRVASMDRTRPIEDRLRRLENGGGPLATGRERRLDDTRVSGRRNALSRRGLENRLNHQAVQGGSLKTWTFQSPYVERVQVILETEGRPLDAEIDLWQGPDNTPQKMKVYNEDGSMRPFNAIIETPRSPNTIAVRNTAQLEFPFDAYVSALDNGRIPSLLDFGSSEYPTTIQGGALRTFAFEPVVDSVQIMLQTDGRPLNARIELLQGPNNNKQVIELYCEDGFTRPFFAIIETPGIGNVVRVVNTATVEFPMTARVEPYEVGTRDRGYYTDEPVMGGDRDDQWWGRNDNSGSWGGDLNGRWGGNRNGQGRSW